MTMDVRRQLVSRYQYSLNVSSDMCLG